MGGKWGNTIVVIVVSVVFLIALAMLAAFFISSGSESQGSFFGGNVGLVPLHGEISNTKDDLFYSNETAFEFIERLEKAVNDPTVSVVLIEINSPGGTPVATKQIVQKIREIEKPVVSWISDVGASGGYYVASSTDLIIADEDSITGSIGAVSVVGDFTGLLEDFGIKMEVLTSGENKDIGSPFSELSEEEREILESIIMQTFNNFKNDVLEFRGDKINMRLFDIITDGRILSGKQAKNAGLIDETGTRAYAIKRAAQLAGISGEPNVKEFNLGEPSFFDLFSRVGYSLGQGFRQGLSANPSLIRT